MVSARNAPPFYPTTSPTAIAVGLVSFPPNSLKQGRLGGWFPVATRGRRIRDGRKPPSRPPENLPISPKILRRGEDATSTVITNSSPQLISRGWKPSRRIRQSRFLSRKIAISKGRELFSRANSSPRFFDGGEWGRRR